jgi:hypothetical protein
MSHHERDKTMPINVQWENDQHKIIRLDYVGKWEWTEFFEAQKQVRSMMNEMTHRVDLLANMQTGTMPTSGASFANAKNAMKNLPDNWGIMVIVTNMIVGKLVDLFKQFDQEYTKKIFTASSTEQALQVIAKHRTDVSSK